MHCKVGQNGNVCAKTCTRGALFGRSGATGGNMQHTISNQTFGQERALYNLQNATVQNCSFCGQEDGESALKECRNIVVQHSNFQLRYPLWHCHGVQISHCTQTETCRAPLWYCSQVDVQHSQLHGIKAVRECNNVAISNSSIQSDEFGWKTCNLRLANCTASGKYFLFGAEGVELCNVEMSGKYSFQYVKNATISHCTLDTKDALWHAENVLVEHCVVKGEYLAWYSKNVTFHNCTIVGTQPLCYCQNLKLVDCTMVDAGLAFENSTVQATVNSHILSVKNPIGGSIVAHSIGEVIVDNPIYPSTCKISIKQ